jgi:hypothetical protein
LFFVVSILGLSGFCALTLSRIRSGAFGLRSLTQLLLKPVILK